MLQNLQLLRAFAAIAVVFYHTDYRLAGNFHTDFNGVAIFFVISGFIMSHITRTDSSNFLIKRAIRIIPMYWICTMTMVLLTHRLGLLLPSTYLKTPLMLDVFRSLFFLPSSINTPILGVGWTLNFEVYFYIVFAAALAINRKFSPIIAAALVLLIISLDKITEEKIFLIHFYSHTYIHYFVAGIIIYYVWANIPTWLIGKFPATLSIILVVLIIGSGFFYPLWPYWLNDYVFLFPALLVACALLAEINRLQIKWKPMLFLGDASYSIYLVHEIIFGILKSFSKYYSHWPLPSPSAGVGTALLYILPSISAAAVVYLYVEKPVLKALRDRFLDKPANMAC